MKSDQPLLDWFPVEEKAKKCKVCGLPDEVYWKEPMVTAALPSHWLCWTKEKKP